jgi:hypothetical protein
MVWEKTNSTKLHQGMSRLHSGLGSRKASSTAQAKTGASKIYVHDSDAGPHKTIQQLAKEKIMVSSPR